MSAINNFLAAKTNQEKVNAIAILEAKYGTYALEFNEQISNSDEWNKVTQFATIERYLESRQEYLTESERFFSVDFDELPGDLDEDKLLEYHLRMISLVQYMGGDLSNIIERAIFLALHDDSEIKWCGSVLLLRASDYLSGYLPEILQIMSKHGLWERPFNIGKVLNQIIDRNPELIEQVVSKLDSSEDENLITSILFTLSERTSIPDICDHHIAQYIKHGTGEIKSIALIAVSIKPQLAKTIENDIWSSLMSDEWFIRGNAARVCGCVQLNPSRFLPKLTEMLTDFEGHDWFPAESAVSAIAKYGSPAIATLPAIENAMNQWIEAEMEEEDSEFIKQCQKTIMHINSLE